MVDVRIVHKMPVAEYGSVKKSLEEWYNHLMKWFVRLVACQCSTVFLQA
jgi:hypothetical protein